MSMWQELTIETPENVDLPPLAGLLGLWRVHVDRALWIHAEGEGYYRAFSVDGADDSPEGEHLPDEHRAYLQFSSKWQTEGLHGFVKATSARYPEAVIYLREEWTGEEPNILREQWEGGRRVGLLDSEGDLIPQAASADPLGAVMADAGLTLAAVLGALGTLGETLGQVAVGEAFWEHWWRREAEDLAAVFDAVGMTTNAEMIRTNVREADPDGWVEQDAV